MRFPSIATLVAHAAAVLRRFPWTLLAGAVAAAAGIGSAVPETALAGGSRRCGTRNTCRITAGGAAAAGSS